MPLVRNEHGPGGSELYREAFRKDEPKEILDGAAVAGLVGILRQLGDLAEYASNVFRDLHEQITATSTRGRKMVIRVRNIEVALPFVEKAFKEEQSHIHFAYISGCDWHVCLQDEQSLLSSELPQFMINSYEDCHDLPRLYLLDKFDHAGTGSCLKRYSDPSYFKRMWAASQMENIEIIRVDKKLQKIKRRESRNNNGGSRHAVYISQHDNSTKFTSPSIDGQKYFVDNVSQKDMKLDPELSSRSMSFDSKCKESYLEQSSFVYPLIVTDESGNGEVPNCKLHCKDSYLSVCFLNNEPTAGSLDDISQHDTLHEQSISRSSSVIWDEKIEIVKSTSPASYDEIPVYRVQDSQDAIRDQDFETLEVNSEPENIDCAKIQASNQEDTLFNIGKISVPLSGPNHIDEVTSETDNYVDALNRLDSETETESECFTKREVNSLSNFSSQGMRSGTEMSPVIVVQNPVYPNSFAVEAQDITPRFSHLSSSDGSEHVESPNATEVLQNQEFSVTDYLCENNAHNESETKEHESESIEIGLSHNSGISGSPTTKIVEATSEASMSKNCPIPDVSVARPAIQLWTNGGLFGVDPSKPPDLRAVNIPSEKSVSGSKISSTGFSRCIVKPQMLVNEIGTKSDAKSLKKEPSSVDFSSVVKVTGDHNSLSFYVHGNSTKGHLYVRGNSEVQKSKGSPSCNDNQHDNNAKQDSQVSEQPLSQTELVQNPEETSTSNSIRPHEVDMTRNNGINGTPPCAVYSTWSREDGASQSKMGISSSFSEIAQRFLANTLQRRADLLTTSENSIEIRGPEETSVDHNKEASNGVASQASYEMRMDEEIAHASAKHPVSSISHYSEQSSAPLEYMKISFHPMNGLENSKLKLELSSGSLHENSEDFMFPSFQLLHGPVDTLEDVCSESDDDTFCRSCPYSSEDIPSPRSYSNSEQWEEGVTSKFIDHKLDFVDHRFQSSITPISRSIGIEQMNHFNMGASSVLGELDAENNIVPFQAGSKVELPGFHSVLLGNQHQEILPEIQANTEVQSKVEIPPPPPLPPMQWTVKPSIPSKDVAMNVPQVLRCSPQTEEQPSQRSPCVVAAVSPNCDEKKQDLQKVNWKKRVNHSVIHKEIDTREDLLHQIRNQSFNLRHTVKRAPREAPQSTNNITNVKVATILQKANAIRQAFVGSDDGGDDDNWSDV
ncbi:SCAR-like protein 2 isoform X1 [Canna indica]|uniref:Protein SCAR n=1 Tax=Canna indica TaxID=4628 RepID=A0AAQ3QGC5_9LILI|nr:SCAR-like protein 2 isoform X1 [Canna indica]